jgi:hypothetical protein
MIEQEDYIHGHIFDAVKYKRTITWQGALMRISDPKGIEQSLKRNDITQNETWDVPAGFEVEVIHD